MTLFPSLRFPFIPLALLLGLIAAAVSAAASEPVYQRGAAYALNPEDGRRIPIPLESTEVRLDVKPGLMEAEIVQTFANRTATALEATYLYPLPDRATLTQFELRYQDRVVRSEVREKVAARVSYEAAKEAGKKTALLEQRDPSLFSTAIANFLPGERVQVVIRLVQPLALTAEAIEVRFPMVTGEKYFPSDALPGTEGNAAPDPLRREEHSDSEIHVYAFDLQIAGIPIRKIESSSHAIRTTQIGTAPERFAVALEKEITIPDRDFVVRIETRADAALQPTVVTQRTATGDYGLVTLFPPRQRPAALVAPRPRDILFLIDRSGSMEGMRLASAKLGLEGCLDALNAQDRFQIVAFDERFEFYRPTWIDGGEKAFAEAHRYVRELHVRGGTELQRALAASLDTFERNERQQILILLTDGDVGNAASLLNLVESKIGQVRLFALGIGAAPNATLLKQIAELGHGQARFIGDDAGVGRELTDLFATLGAPVLAQPRLTLLDAQENPLPYVTFPERLPDVFLGRPVQVVYRLAKGAPAAIRLEGVENERPVVHRLPLQPAVLRGDGLEKEFGRRLFADTGMMLRRATSEEERTLVRNEMLATALQFQLVTELTSRVAIDDRVSRDPNAALVSEEVAQYRAADQPRITMVGGEPLVELTPFEVNAENSGGYVGTCTLSGTRSTTTLYHAGLSLTLNGNLLEGFVLPTTEAMLPFAIDPLVNPVVGRSGSNVGLLDGLPIATVIDPATMGSLTLQAAGPALSEIEQLRPPRQPATTLIGRVGSDGFFAGSLQTAFHPAGDDGTAGFAIVSWAKLERPQTSVFLEGEKTIGETRMRVGTQWRRLPGYGDMRIVRGALERKLGDGLLLEAAVAWHELNRNDAAQFRLGSATALYDGLGFLNLDLLTAETRRLVDAIGQLKLSGQVRGLYPQTWTARALFHRQESDWLTLSETALAASRRDTGELNFSHRIGFADDRLNFETRLGWASHATERTTRDRQTTSFVSLNLDRELSATTRAFASWSREEALPWSSTGWWRPVGGEWRAVAPTIEIRAGGQAGLKFEAESRQFDGTMGVFHEAVSGHAYRDWNWAQAHPLPLTVLAGEEMRGATSTSVARDFIREGWTGSLGYHPSRSLTASTSWSIDWKNQGPERGGNVRGSALVGYEFSTGRLKGFNGGVAVHWRNDLVFGDGFTLQGGLRADAMFGYRVHRSGSRRETQLRLNVVNLADRSWQLTRFAPDRGRQLFFTVTQGF